MRIMAPISAILLASSELVTSVSRRGNSVFAFYGSTSSRRVGNLLRLLEEFLSTPSPPASLWHRILGHLSYLTFLVPDGMFRMRLLQPCLQDQWDFLDDQFQVSWFPLCREFFFSGGLEWPSCVKEYPSLFQSQKSAYHQTLRMWVAGPHRRTPRLGPFVSSSEDSLHQPERASSSSVRPEGLRTPVGGPVGSSVLQQHHHSNVCPSPAAFIMGSSNVSADALRRPIW